MGLLHRELLAIGTVLAAFWGLAEILRAALGETSAPDTKWRATSYRRATNLAFSNGFFWGAVVLAAVAAGAAFVAGLAPPTAGDALCYHLELPKRFLLEHRLVFLPDCDNSTFPLLTEMWYAWGLALDGPVAAQLMHGAVGVLAAMAAAVLARPLLGARGGWLCGACVLLTPGVTNQMTAPLNDAALMLWTALATAAWWRAITAGGSPRWYVVAGLMTGAAASTKYLAALFVVSLIVVTLGRAATRSARRRPALLGLCTILLVALGAAGPWYLHAAWRRGNPVHPFFHEWLVDAQRSADLPATLPESKSRLGRTPLDFATAPWRVTFWPEAYGGRAHQLGALPLVGLPAWLVARRRRGMGLLLAMASAYFACWFLLRQNVRFLLPALPWLSVPLVAAWLDWPRWPVLPRRIAAAATVVLLAVGAAASVDRAAPLVRVAMGRESREDFLLAHEPTYAAAAVAQALSPTGMHLLSQDYRGFYFPGRVTREHAYRRRTRYDQRVRTPGEFAAELRAAGITHLLLVETDAGQAVRYDPTLARLVDRAEASLGADRVPWRVLHAYTHRASDAVRRVRLLELLTAEEASTPLAENRAGESRGSGEPPN
jgi:Dolichyl-phosphate-mannose-protein mannosyltransferase